MRSTKPESGRMETLVLVPRLAGDIVEIALAVRTVGAERRTLGLS